MKTFKQHVKEGMSPLGVGVTTSNSVEDGSIGVHNIENADVLKRVNAFVGSIAEREFIKPQHAVDELREKLHRIGLTVSPVDLNDDNGRDNTTFAAGHDGGASGTDFAQYGGANVDNATGRYLILYWK